MSEQQHQQTRRATQADAEEVLRLQASAGLHEQDSSLDDLLDQIDAVIDANPEGYVRSFVQRGGQ
ncbi:ubiquitin-like protein Pup [Propionibacteriaceae bacterium Y1923]|uniref:ubiquitin-like protein Pup n=1 Tax=Aestuariimicrobium sp. Y1814 TaxID=3418742 RepID=UPI003C1CDA8D